MIRTSLPLPLTKAALRFLPKPFLLRSVAGAVEQTKRRHPALFANLARLPVAKMLLVPSDLPHAFILRTGENPLFRLARKNEKAEATVTGPLEALVDMLEGRADGDSLFFSRDITVEGDATLIVGLRNTLDREEIDLYQEILFLCGPFKTEISFVLGLADRLVGSLRRHA